jgi:hypothetical protein
MIVILAARESLFDTPRPESEFARDYVPALRQSLARAAGDGLTADYFRFTTKGE